MYVLYSFGNAVEYFYGKHFGSNAIWFYMLLYAGGLIVSDIPTFLKHQHNVSYRGLGASGAVSSVLFASILFAPTMQLGLFFVIPMPAIVLGVGYLVYSAYMSKNRRDNINHDAHFYGAVFGFFFTWLLKPSLMSDFFDKILHTWF